MDPLLPPSLSKLTHGSPIPFDSNARMNGDPSATTVHLNFCRRTGDPSSTSSRLKFYTPPVLIPMSQQQLYQHPHSPASRYTCPLLPAARHFDEGFPPSLSSRRGFLPRRSLPAVCRRSKEGSSPFSSCPWSAVSKERRGRVSPLMHLLSAVSNGQGARFCSHLSGRPNTFHSNFTISI